MWPWRGCLVPVGLDPRLLHPEPRRSKKGADGGRREKGSHPGPGGRGQTVCVCTCVNGDVHICMSVCACVSVCSRVHSASLPGAPGRGMIRWLLCRLPWWGLAVTVRTMCVLGPWSVAFRPFTALVPGSLGHVAPACPAFLPEEGVTGPPLQGTQDQGPLRQRWLGRRTASP